MTTVSQRKSFPISNVELQQLITAKSNLIWKGLLLNFKGTVSCREAWLRQKQFPEGGMVQEEISYEQNCFFGLSYIPNPDFFLFKLEQQTLFKLSSQFNTLLWPSTKNLEILISACLYKMPFALTCLAISFYGSSLISAGSIWYHFKGPHCSLI